MHTTTPPSTYASATLRRYPTVLVLLIIPLSWCTAKPIEFTSEPINLGNRIELFVDSYLIHSLNNTSLKLHTPRDAGVALRFDAPWDGAASGFATILNDNGAYKMYYVGLPLKDADEVGGSYLCYAESTDGITWTKPDLGLVNFQGSTANNILMAPDRKEPFVVNFSPFIDTRPGEPANVRYKAVGGLWPKGLFLLGSADGIKWRKLRNDPIFTQGAFDSQNVAFWSESERCYVLYFRVFGSTDYRTLKKWAHEGPRTIAKTTSDDLITWSEPRRMSFGNTKLEQFYTNHTHPYFRSPSIYISMPMRFIPGRRFLSDDELRKLGVLPQYLQTKGHSFDIPNEISDTVFMTSRGGYRYDRTFMEAFIRPGIDKGNWVSRNGIPVTGIVQTGDEEMSLYVAQNYAQPSAHLRRFSMRLDGLASVSASYDGGEMITKPIVVSGNELVLNCATSAAGSIYVELQEPDGEPIPGFMLAESELIVGDAIEYVVRWKLESGIERLAGQPVRIRFVMQDADLFSLRFR